MSNSNQLISIHIGINEINPVHYQNWNKKLQSAVQDASDLSQIAWDLGYKPQLYAGKNATRKAIFKALKEAGEKLGENGQLLLSFSGWGTMLPSFPIKGRSGDYPAWCLYDRCLLREELMVLWAGWPEGVQITIIEDTSYGECPAGHWIKDYTCRSLPQTVAQKVYEQNKDQYDSIQLKIPINPIVLASVSDFKATEHHQFALEDKKNGLFIQRLKRLIGRNVEQFHFRNLAEALLSAIPLRPFSELAWNEESLDRMPLQF